MSVVFDWVAVKELKSDYHKPETSLFTVYPLYGNFITEFLNSQFGLHKIIGPFKSVCKVEKGL